MNLSAPKRAYFLISLVLAVLALLAAVGINLPYVSGLADWFALVAYAVLLAGCMVSSD